MEFRPPSFVQPKDYSGITKSLDDLFNAYTRGKQEKQMSELQALQMQNAQGQALTNQVQQAEMGIAPGTTPSMITQAQGPAPVMQGVTEDPQVATLRKMFDEHKKKRETAAQSDTLDLDLKRSTIGKNNAEAAKDLAAAGGQGAIPIADRARIEGQIMDDYMKSPTYSNLAAAKSGLRDLASIQSNKSGAADIAAIYSFVKTMDNNAVKEGEIQLAQSAIPGLDRVKLIYDSMKSGNKLTPEMKRELLTVSKGMYDSKLKSLDEFRSPFVNRSKQYGINPDIAVPGLSIPQDELSRMFPPEAPTPANGAKPIALQGPQAARLAELRAKAAQQRRP
jgi:hypothetical protein